MRWSDDGNFGMCPYCGYYEDEEAMLRERDKLRDVEDVTFRGSQLRRPVRWIYAMANSHVTSVRAQKEILAPCEAYISGSSGQRKGRRKRFRTRKKSLSQLDSALFDSR